jgi:hypothetical protein
MRGVVTEQRRRQTDDVQDRRRVHG